MTYHIPKDRVCQDGRRRPQQGDWRYRKKRPGAARDGGGRRGCAGAPARGQRGPTQASPTAAGSHPPAPARASVNPWVHSTAPASAARPPRPRISRSFTQAPPLRGIRRAAVTRLRKALVPRTSQRALAARLQLQGLDVDKNAVQRIESGQRFVTDIELAALARALEVTPNDLLAPVPPV